jgi:hypothetical protein
MSQNPHMPGDALLENAVRVSAVDVRDVGY